MPLIRTLIVDDEPLGRRRIQALLDQEADVAVVGACANGAEAVVAIQRHRPDLVFLDVQMPVLNGFDVLTALDDADAGTPTPEAYDRPAVIFVTAYDRYALRAFDVHALDYLLKPFDRDRFRAALARARTHLRHRTLAAREAATYPARLPIKDGGRLYFVDVDAIDWIEAAGNYAGLHAGGKTHLLRETMNGLEARLDPRRFIRIHRSRFVNAGCIAAIRPTAGGGYLITLRDGQRLQASRTYRSRLQPLMRPS